MDRCENYSLDVLADVASFFLEAQEPSQQDPVNFHTFVHNTYSTNLVLNVTVQAMPSSIVPPIHKAISKNKHTRITPETILVMAELLKKAIAENPGVSKSVVRDAFATAVGKQARQALRYIEILRKDYGTHVLADGCTIASVVKAYDLINARR